VRCGKKTDLKSSEVIDKAQRFFGDGGVGLNMAERSAEMIFFEGGEGHVTTSVCSNDKTDVNLEMRDGTFKCRSSWSSYETAHLPSYLYILTLH
jgi:hypothetical protein